MASTQSPIALSFVCLCLYHDVCPDDLTMKDWCHTNNILQVHCRGCLVVQVMFHALITSSMTSPGHKIGQILKVIYLRQYLNYSVDQKLKMSEILMAIFLVYSPSGIASGKKVCRELKMAAIMKILKYQTQLQFDLRYENIVPNYAKKVFSCWRRHRWRRRVASNFLYIFMFRRGWLREQIARAMSRQ